MDTYFLGLPTKHDPHPRIIKDGLWGWVGPDTLPDRLLRLEVARSVVNETIAELKRRVVSRN